MMPDDGPRGLPRRQPRALGARRPGLGGGRASRCSARAAGVSRWLLEAIAPQPGQTVLELAAGPGDTGLMAAGLVAPDGKVIVTDFAEEMVAIARARAAELGLANVEVRQMEAEWIDLPAASVDGVLCRWGYMLLADPEAALRETRRVLRPGGRVALAVWDAPAHNPWLARRGPRGGPRGPLPAAPTLPAAGTRALRARRPRARRGAAADGRLRRRRARHGRRHLRGRRASTRGGIRSCARRAGCWRRSRRCRPAEHYALRDAVDAAYAPWVGDDGRLRVPGRTLVASATA